MKEIKFRIFNKQEEEFLNEEDYAINFVGTVFKACLDEEVFEVLDADMYIVTQYTGLKDKNGVDIYEGDIVIADCRSGHNWENGKYIIEYDSTNCCFYGNPRPVKQLFDLRLNVIHCEPISDLRQKIKVIGNIYENPELLEQTK